MFVVPESFQAARSADLFVVLPEALLDFVPALSFPESDPVLVVVLDHREPALVAASIVVFVPVRRSFRRTRDMLRPPAELNCKV